MNEIIVDKVSKSYGKKQVLFDVSLEVEKGSIFGLIGPSGCGKTTLVKNIVGLLEPDAGEITVAGERVPSKKVIPTMGYMAQAAALYMSLTGKENLEFFGKLYGLDKQTLKTRIEHVARLVNLTDDLEKKVADYSGGMQQRLSLATALIHEPSILVLDEPTVGIDPVLRFEIWKELNELSSNGVTIIITTHVMDEAEKCDKLAMMRDGKVLAVGTASRLIEKAHAEDFEDAFIKLGGGADYEN